MRLQFQLGWFVLALVSLAGCSTIEGYPVRWPWTKPSVLAEKYDVPPENDSRYNNPPSYPKNTMTAELKPESTGAGRPSNRLGTAGIGAGGPGGIGGVGPGMR